MTTRGTHVALAIAVGAVGLVGCGGSAGPASKLPPAPPGCAVSLYPEAPDVPTESIGPVSASCAVDVSDADCIRTLQDQVCKLGGNVAWGVDETPKLDLNRKTLKGRAARTK